MVKYLHPYVRVVLDENAREYLNGNIQRTHETLPMSIQGRVVGIDKGIWTLIDILNGISGVVTTFSCQGGDSNPVANGYVLLHGPKSTEVVIKLLRLCPDSLSLEASGHLKMPKLSSQEAKKALLSDSLWDRITAQVKIPKSPLGWGLRWPYNLRNHVLRAAKQIREK